MAMTAKRKEEWFSQAGQQWDLKRLFNRLRLLVVSTVVMHEVVINEMVVK